MALVCIFKLQLQGVTHKSNCQTLKSGLIWKNIQILTALKGTGSSLGWHGPDKSKPSSLLWTSR